MCEYSHVNAVQLSVPYKEDCKNYLLIIFFRYDSGRKSEGSKSRLALLAVTLKLLLEPNQLLLVIINIFIGYQQAFFGADFTAVSMIYTAVNY